MVKITVGRMRNSENKSRTNKKHVVDDASASLATSSYCSRNVQAAASKLPNTILNDMDEAADDVGERGIAMTTENVITASKKMSDENDEDD